MAADAWKIYDSAKEKIADGTVDMDDVTADTFKCALFTSSLTPAATDDSYSVTNEVANGNGYTTGGLSLTGVTWVESAGTVTWDCDNIVWTASGGSIVARYGIIYHVASNQLIAMCLLNNAPADVTATTGNTFTITINASGVFTLSGGW